MNPVTLPNNMTQERFVTLIEQPDLLSTISYEELKTLAFAYPYAHNLRYLLALKSQQEHHPEAGRNLQTAAAYSLDRKQLFLLVVPKQLTPVRVAAPEVEEILELKPLETIRRERETLAPLERMEQVVEPLQGQVTTPDVSVSMPREPEPEFEMPDAPLLKVATQVPESKSVIPEKEPMSFAEWMGQFHPLALDKPVAPVVREPRRQAPKDPATMGIAQQLAEKSVAENKQVVSETLARLLAMQGHKEKAIDMYMRLSLANPEKSPYFAAEIEKLKK